MPDKLTLVTLQLRGSRVQPSSPMCTKTNSLTSKMTGKESVEICQGGDVGVVLIVCLLLLSAGLNGTAKEISFLTIAYPGELDEVSAR